MALIDEGATFCEGTHQYDRRAALLFESEVSEAMYVSSKQASYVKEITKEPGLTL